MKQFRRVGEATVDARKRITLGKACDYERYEIGVSDDGEIRLIPLVSIPASQLGGWSRDEMIESFRRGVEQAERGELYDLGSFAQYLDEPDDD